MSSAEIVIIVALGAVGSLLGKKPVVHVSKKVATSVCRISTLGHKCKSSTSSTSSSTSKPSNKTSSEAPKE